MSISNFIKRLAHSKKLSVFLISKHRQMETDLAAVV